MLIAFTFLPKKNKPNLLPKPKTVSLELKVYWIIDGLGEMIHMSFADVRMVVSWEDAVPS